MLPAKRNKIDISTLTEEEQKLFRLYGKLPSHKNVLSKMQKDHRKYFDSGDYALSKAGKVSQTAVGTAIPSPENIPHASSPPTHQGSLSISPTNSMSSTQSSLAHSESETKDDENDKEQLNDEEESASSAQNFNATQCNLGLGPGSCAV